MQTLLTIKEASIWASRYLEKEVTTSNISYLVQYGRIAKTRINGSVCVNQVDLEKYYAAHQEDRESVWKQRLGDDLNWNLSFAQYKESQTTKHVHRLHPYKGKFIPQLVEYFLGPHTDTFKQKRYFNPGDIVLDPFCGSGTTLVQANELGIHAVGVDVSAFNAFIGNIKVGKFDLQDAHKTAREITQKLQTFQTVRDNVAFEKELLEALNEFNSQFFPSPDFRYKVRQGEIDEKQYGREKEQEFLAVYHKLVRTHKIELQQQNSATFLDKWFLKVVRDEIDFVWAQVKTIPNPATKKLLALVLSRTIRSCRATTHADLGTLKEPVLATYYCKKHGKVCKPLFSILSWWQRYCHDTIKRVQQFSELRTDTLQKCLVGDSREIDLLAALREKSPELAARTKTQKIDGIFSSPPYVGLIDYHEQHAYAYDLLGFERRDGLEIGPLYRGQGREAQQSYVQGIAAVLNNAKQFLKADYDVFLVANDKNRLYPQIAELAGMQIVNEYKRPVLNRVEKDRSAYAEIIFHMKGR